MFVFNVLRLLEASLDFLFKIFAQNIVADFFAGIFQRRLFVLVGVNFTELPLSQKFEPLQIFKHKFLFLYVSVEFGYCIRE
jgi:hypothetical protein